MNDGRGVSSGRRFLVYFIDFFIISTVVSLLMPIVELIFKNINANYIAYNTAYNELYNAYLDVLKGISNINNLYECLNKVMPSLGLYLGFYQLILIIIMLVYLIIIPIFNKKHLTLGRLLCKVRVVSLKHNEMTKSDIIIRETLSYLFYMLIPFIGFISAVFAILTGDSLVDKCSSTRMIYDNCDSIDNNDNIENSFNSNDKNYNDEVINPKVDVINDDVNNHNSNNDSKNDNNDNSEDEYKTF